jgi:hypothetical protein
MKKTFLLIDKMICHSSDSKNKFNVPDRYAAGCQFLVAHNVQPSYINEENWKWKIKHTRHSIPMYKQHEILITASIPNPTTY